MPAAAPVIEVIESDRLTLEPFAETFLTERYVGWLNDPAVTAHSRHRRTAHTPESCRAFAAGLKAAGHYFWAIVAKDDRELGHIGNLAAYIDAPARTADLTILIGERAAWGRGFGSEAWIAAVGWLFERAGVETITAGTEAANAAMVGIMKKAGMKIERREKTESRDGRDVTVDYVYGTLEKNA